MKFLKHTIGDKRVMGKDNLSQLYTLFNAAYGAHPNLKSLTYGGIPFGYKLVHCKSIKKLIPKVALGPK